MNEIKHTPGPWEVRVTASGNPFVYRADGVIIAGVAMVREGMCMEENESNAALIAQAPELLAEVARLRQINAELVAALEDCITDAGSPCYRSGTQVAFDRRLGYINNTVRAALAKAKE